MRTRVARFPLLVRCGFEVEALYGGFDKRPFDERSAEQVWVARKS